jgi:sugar phosphate isomerase/epimerase
MIRLSAFADEISPRLDEQIAVLHAEGIRHLDLRSVDDVNVLDLRDAQVARIRETLRTEGAGVAAIGSPIGKVPIDSPLEETITRFDRALHLAGIMGARFVRVFSFYPPAGERGWTAGLRDEVIERVRLMTERARAAGIVLVHENEKGIYGDTAERCVDLLQSIDDPHLRAAFDPANFIQCGEAPYPAAYNALRDWIASMHVKDALPDGQVVPAGRGVAGWPEILRALRQDGYDGFLSLEPHLQAAGRFRGFSGPALFHEASQALQGLLAADGS